MIAAHIPNCIDGYIVTKLQQEPHNSHFQAKDSIFKKYNGNNISTVSTFWILLNCINLSLSFSFSLSTTVSHHLPPPAEDRHPHGLSAGRCGRGENATLLPVWEQCDTGQQVWIGEPPEVHQRQSHNLPVSTCSMHMYRHFIRRYCI